MIEDHCAPAPLQTFRDPAGSLEFKEHSVLRSVFPKAKEQALDILSSGFYKKGRERREIVDSQICEATARGGMTLEHPRVFFPSYCWEWAPAQWVAAGTLTLQICEAALDEGWILKDATPLNVLFEGSAPLFVDVLSFERRGPRSPIWTAQAQFIRTFLLPLIARRWLGWPLAGSLARRDGITPDELLPGMPWLALMRPMLFRNVLLPALLERRTRVTEETIEAAKSRAFDPEIATALLKRMLRSLRTQLQEASGGLEDSRWKHYQENLSHYLDTDQQDKQRFVEECLERLHPAAVLDVGTNTGFYALLAARSGARVVAIDTDVASVEMLCRTAQSAGADVQALVVNLARPTPAVGWQCREQLSFLDRAATRFDLVLMLAVIHHLLLTEQIPLHHIAKLCSELTRRWLILEWVPSDDPMFRQLLRGRAALYDHLSVDELLGAMSGYFRMERMRALANGRILYLFEKIA
jgi:SAM-dependent methyltransferase